MFDTMIKVEDSTGMVMIKPGKRAAILEAVKARGPGAEEVRKRVLEVIKGRKVIGYGIKAKM